jgi:hypothetical protein
MAFVIDVFSMQLLPRIGGYGKAMTKLVVPAFSSIAEKIPLTWSAQEFLGDTLPLKQYRC